MFKNENSRLGKVKLKTAPFKQRLDELPPQQMLKIAKAFEKKQEKRLLMLTNNKDIIEFEGPKTKAGSFFADNPSNDIIDKMK
jgi:hypothetical protein